MSRGNHQAVDGVYPSAILPNGIDSMDATPLYLLILSLPTALIVWVLWWRGMARHPAQPFGTLGILDSTHRKAYRGALAGGCVLLVLGVFPLMIGLAWIPDADGWILTAFGLALVLSSSPLVWRALVNRSIRIDRYTDGLVYHCRDTVAVIPWSAIATIKRHSDPHTYALILETIPAGRIDLAGMRDGRRLTDAILLATAHRRTPPVWNSLDHEQNGTAPAGLGERLFNAVGCALLLVMWVGLWIGHWPLHREHVLGGVIGLALGIVASSRHARQQDWEIQRWDDPQRTVTRVEHLDIPGFAMLVVIVMARAGLVEHLLGKPAHDFVFFLVVNGFFPLITYAVIHDWRSARGGG